MSDHHDLSHNWRAQVDFHGEWLVVQLYPAADGAASVFGLVDSLWWKLGSPTARRVLLEMTQVAFLSSSLMGELVRLHKRLAVSGGMLHICSLRHECFEALRITRLDQVLPVFGTRDEALRSFTL